MRSIASIRRVCASEPRSSMTALSPLAPVACSFAVAAIAVAGCSSGESYTDTYDSKLGVSSSPRLAVSGPIPKGGGDYKVGSPYQIAGRWYYPRHEPGYSEVGVGSWYGPGFHGRKTANGEVFDMNALTAAHKTLPLPTYAYVTNLDNGRTILVRVNDRGPYVDDRLIDLSKAAADALGYGGRGLSRVRVRYAGDAPLDGNDQRERTFLASQPWAGNTRYASSDTPTDGWQTTSRQPLRPMDSAQPMPQAMRPAYRPQQAYAPPPSYSTKQMTQLPPVYAANAGYPPPQAYAPQTYASQQMPPAYPPQYPAQPAYPSQQYFPPQPAPQMPPQASAYASEPLAPQQPPQSASGQTWSPFDHRAGYSQRSGLGAAPSN